MKAKATVAGFFSYVHEDDEFENGRISRLRERLERAIRFYTGHRDFHIFQDWQDIGWGKPWEKVIAESIENSVVLFPVVTPSYFSSEPCRKEILAFEERQARVRRDDLILPIYYLLSEPMEDSDAENGGSGEARVAELIKRAQFADWRALRRTQETDLAYGEAIERLARRAIPALKRGMTASAAGRTSGENRTQEAGRNDGLPRRAAKPGGTKRQTRSTKSPRSTATSSPPTAAERSPPAETHRGVAGETVGPAAAPGYVAMVTVDQMPGRGDFTTISDAIARAAAGALVQIRPGHYREQLVINKPLELVGDGPREDIIVDADEGCTLEFDTNIGVVRGLTLRQSGNKKFFGVWVKQGRLALEDCDLSGANLSCLAVSNNADPRVRRNLIHNSKQSGVVVFAQGRGTYEDNELFGNGFQGFSAKEEADPIVRRNRIHDNKQAGINVYKNGRGTYEDNEVFENGLSGFHAKEEAEPIVRRNRIHENEQNGIYVSANGRGTYEDNEIVSNGGAGVYAGSAGAPAVRRNRINKNIYQAVYVGEGGAGLYEDNDLRENTQGPWGIHASASAELKRARNLEE